MKKSPVLKEVIDMLSGGSGDTGSAVREAARKGYSGCLRSLIASGAEVNQMNKADSKRETPLGLAARNGHPDCVRMLVKAGAKLDVVDSEFRTPLMLAMDRGDSGHKILVEHKECVNILLEAGADLTLYNQKWETPFLTAVDVGDYECIQMLVRAGADVNGTGPGNKTALIRMAEKGNHYAEYLLDAPVKIGLKDSSGKSALIHAIDASGSYIFPHIVELLIIAGADRDDCFRALNHMARKDCERDLCCDLSSPVEFLLSLELRLSFRTPRDFQGHRNGQCSFYDHVFQRVKVPPADDPRILSHICRKFIRSHLLSLNTVSLFYRIPRLRLPEALVNFLLYHEELEMKIDLD